MTEQKYLRPREGISLPLADGRPWPADGTLVDVDQYVRRRIADGDLVAATPPAEPVTSAAADEAVAEPAASKKGK